MSDLQPVPEATKTNYLRGSLDSLISINVDGILQKTKPFLFPTADVGKTPPIFSELAFNL